MINKFHFVFSVVVCVTNIEEAYQITPGCHSHLVLVFVTEKEKREGKREGRDVA